MYKFDEVKILVDYAQSIVFEAVQANLRANGDHKVYEEISRRLLRRVSRLLIYPELIIDKSPKETPTKARSLTTLEREQLISVIGDSSRKLKSMCDLELFEEVRALVKYYR